MHILIIGREGQVAHALCRAAVGDIVIDAVGRAELDITDRASIDRAIDRCSPDILVNAAAYTAVDKAETDEATAFAVNGLGAGNAAAAAAVRGIPIIQISTDYVFSGEKVGAYHEDDETRPINVYGRSKLLGEQAVKTANPAHVILRTSWVYAPWGANFLRTMLRLAAERDFVRIVSDQRGAPTYAPDIADGVLAVARKALADVAGASWRGVFHMTAAGATSWAAFAEAIFAASNEIGGPSASMEHITTAEYPTPARRPANSLLDNTKFHLAFKETLPAWRTGVTRCIAELF